MVNIAEESFRLNIAVLRAAGLYPPEKNIIASRIRMYGFYSIFYILLIVLASLNIVMESHSDITQMNLMVIFLLEIGAFSLKILPFFIDGNRMKNCINHLGDSRFAPKDTQEANILDECKDICRRNSLAYFILIAISYCLWIFPFLLAEDYKLPLDVWLPYDFTRDPIVFYGTFLYVSIAFIFDGFVGALLDPLIGGLAYQATCQLKILKYNLQYLDATAKDLKRCIQHHDDILNFVREFENCFSWPVFCNFTASSLALAFSLLSLILGSRTSIVYVKNLMCLTCLPFQIFFYCYYGTLLFEENNGIREAIYMGDWYTYDTDIRKFLIVIMERSKRPLIVTSGKVIDLTLQTFASVIKTSYSLMAVFNNYDQ